MKMELTSTIKHLAEAIQPEMVRIRRAIHRNPELSFQEFETSDLIRRELDNFNIEYTDPSTETGVIAHVRGAHAGPTILLRADIDALPIHEQTDSPFISKNSGVMHACGHDMHTASLLGCGYILHQLREHLKGTIRLVFQPAEEKLPGGASSMISGGILDATETEPAPSYCIAQHVMPSSPAGTLGFRSGPFMASADEIYIRIEADGGHAAKPEDLSADSILVAAHMIVALQSIVSRTIPPEIPSVLTIGRIEADGATNIIPSKVLLEGTFRCFDENWRQQAWDRILQVIHHTATAYGAAVDVDIKKGYPGVINDPSLTKLAQDTAAHYLGQDQVEMVPIWMAGEDFAYFSEKCDSLLYTLGVGPSDDLHTPTFCPDESALEIGSGFMAFLTNQAIHNLIKS